MSRKKRVLRRLHLVESDLQKTAKTNSKAMWGIVSKGLIAARDIWQEGLTEKTYLAYGEIYDGLILASQQMAASEEKSIEADTISLCRELLQYLIGQTEKETAVKKDIVFLPYKASMWDSLESVWKAAYADKEHCNAYVMPIPYCDRNPDGSVAEWHCERDLFPKYVPTLDWQKVDLMAWHPDIILYHYPYDDYNRVTSLDGRYYSRNLRQCADKLVYIPYFVLEEPCTEESVEHFVTTQGVLNADKVIVQSEAMRELYINILMKRTNQPDRAYWEERISGAGSPKIEKVLTSKKEDFEMPENWKRLVDGKKVIFYNTSLTAMLQNSDKVCDKLRYVFDVFRDRDDVVLWWRPHPLMKSTFHAMHPKYEEEYLSIEKQYIEDGWGVYDDTADLHRAICWSDAYYGDQSSVVSLYEKTGKPIILEDFFNVPNSDGSLQEDILVWPTDFLISDDYAWIVHGHVNLLFKYDLKKKNLIDVVKIPSEGMIRDFPYMGMVLHDNTLYLLPRTEDKIAVYDIINNSFCMLEIPSAEDEKFSFMFTDAYEYEETIYCIPSMYPYVLKLNTATHNITKTINVHEVFRINGYNIYAIRACCSFRGKIICVAKNNQLFIYNMIDDTYEMITVGREDSAYIDVTIYEHTVYLYDINYHEIVAYDVINMKIIFVVCVSELVTDIACVSDNRILLMSCNTDYYAKMQPVTGEIMLIQQPRFKHGALGSYYKHNIVKTFNGKTYIYDIRCCSIREIDQNGKCEQYDIKINNNIKQILDVFLTPKTGELLGVEYGHNIPSRLSEYINETNMNSVKATEAQTTGEKIYKAIIDLCNKSKG